MKSKIQNWKPKVGEAFDAFLVATHKKHYCSPFTRVVPGSGSKKYIYAEYWCFNPLDFYFVPVKK